MKSYHSGTLINNHRTRIRTSSSSSSVLWSSMCTRSVVVVVLLLLLGGNNPTRCCCEAFFPRRKVSTTVLSQAEGRNQHQLQLLLQENNSNTQSQTTLSTSPLFGIRGGATTTAKKKKKFKATTKKSKKKKKNKKKKSKKSSKGSSSSTVMKTKKSKKKKNKKKKSKTKDDATKEAIRIAIEEKDAAKALGYAIRSRADELRRENPMAWMTTTMDKSDAMGQHYHHHQQQQVLPDFVADFQSYYWDQQQQQDVDDYNSNGNNAIGAKDDGDGDGGVAGSPTAVVVSYFLKSHGGNHGLQCLCSLMSTLMGLASLLVPKSNNNNNNNNNNNSVSIVVRQFLLKQSVLFAMTKHVAWVLGRAIIIAKSIPQKGPNQIQNWLEQLSKDPISHYMFYTACVLLWLPSSSSTSTTRTPITFAGDLPCVSALLVGPILLREVVSTLLVVSDILVLFRTSTSTDNQHHNHNAAIERILQISQKIINSFMCLLVTPKQWKDANPAKRQRIVAKITARVSLVLEIMVGIVFVLDALVQMGRIVTMGNNSGGAAAAAEAGATTTRVAAGIVKPTFGLVIKRLLCSRIYLQYLLSRKQKISKLGIEIQDGLGKLPFYFLDVLMNPMQAMGLLEQEKAAETTTRTKRKKKKLPSELTWKDYLVLGLGLDEWMSSG